MSKMKAVMISQSSKSASVTPLNILAEYTDGERSIKSGKADVVNITTTLRPADFTFCTERQV